MWQVSPAGGALTWSSAKTHCDKLMLCGYSDWRLPSVSELRSLIRGCSATVTGGACTVADSCTKRTCMNSSCNGCKLNSGPTKGCYWPTGISGDCDHNNKTVNGSYYTSSEIADRTIGAWVISFSNGGVWYHYHKTVPRYVRCVR